MRHPQLGMTGSSKGVRTCVIPPGAGELATRVYPPHYPSFGFTGSRERLPGLADVRTSATPWRAGSIGGQRHVGKQHVPRVTETRPSGASRGSSGHSAGRHRWTGCRTHRCIERTRQPSEPLPRGRPSHRTARNCRRSVVQGALSFKPWGNPVRGFARSCRVECVGWVRSHGTERQGRGRRSCVRQTRGLLRIRPTAISAKPLTVKTIPPPVKALPHSPGANAPMPHIAAPSARTASSPRRSLIMPRGYVRWWASRWSALVPAPAGHRDARRSPDSAASRV